MKSEESRAEYLKELLELGQGCIQQAKRLLTKAEPTADELQALAELTMSAADVFNTLDDEEKLLDLH